ncbi:UTP--glucose-1-phosphate uridylyltransferase [Plasmodium gonderi]|uniref:UTP-monosaccharide-1-phosphate uridylyltransferase n=1 Tax=Plasmodium gonderi TaxID=77519 RepID=A0A1Y1JLX9_PLAGO|nr:UTP--glucose-1-phosphate uridylyltransferase [Plasmodium gonderi]GAW81383.1 UTP--glucose-1-phosphate uridylyltransferase [Plasmodium gonderi]
MRKIDKLIKIIKDEDKKYIEDLISAEQTELLNHDELNEKNILDIIKQIKEFELVYPDGFLKYIKRAKSLLKKSKNKINNFSNCLIEKPDNIIKIKFPWNDTLHEFDECRKMERQLYLSDSLVYDKDNSLNVSSSKSSHSTEEDEKQECTKRINTEYDTTAIFTQNSNSISLSEGGITPMLSPSSSNDEIFDTTGNRKFVSSLCAKPKGVKINERERGIGRAYEIETGRECEIEAEREKELWEYGERSLEGNEIQLSTVTCEKIAQIVEYIRYEEVGLSQIDRVCFVLLAGGLGERLNHKDIKLKLLTNLISEKTYIEYYCNYIKSFQEYIKKNKKKDIDIPFIIMLSDDTYEKTISFFENNNFFSLKRHQIHFLKQGKVLCFKDNEAHIDFTFQNGTFHFSRKPHGHGDIHSLILNNIDLDSLIKQGYNYLYFFQDTNALAMKVLYLCLGISIDKQLHMNFLAISRKPGEEIGAICSLTSMDNCKKVVNIEYNMLESIITGSGEKEIVDEDGYSLYPGNTSAIVFELRTYNELLKKTNGFVPEYINPKYADESRKHFLRPTRVETMMQDFAFLYCCHECTGEIMSKHAKIGEENGVNSDSIGIPNDLSLCGRGRVGVTQLDRCLCFSAVKNDSLKATYNAQRNIHPECMFSAESDLYYNNCVFLQLACMYNRKKFVLDKIEMKTFNGVQYFMPPKVLIEPEFAFTLSEMIKKVKGNITIRNKSTLWIKSDALIRNLYLDGALIIEKLNCEDTILPVMLEKNVCIRNRGYELVPLTDINENNSVHLQIRRYKLVKKEALIISS